MFSVHRIVRRRPELFGSCRVGGGSLARTPGTAGDTHLASTYQAGSCGGVTPPGRGRHAGRHHQLPDMSHDRMLSANFPGGSFGRKLGKVRRLGEANPAFPDARHEFASSIESEREPSSPRPHHYTIVTYSP